MTNTGDQHPGEPGGGSPAGWDSPESADRSATAEDAPIKESAPADLQERVERIASWASSAKKDLTSLKALTGVLTGRTEILPELEAKLDALAAAVAAAETRQVMGPPAEAGEDPVMGYKPTPEQQAALFAALAEWQVTVSAVPKGAVATRDGDHGQKKVLYSYSDIGAITEVARTAGKHGLCHFHRNVPGPDGGAIRTYLVHSSGGFIYADVPLVANDSRMNNSMQRWGSASTYARRYGLYLVMGIAQAGDDDDGASAGAPAAAPTRAARPAAAAQPTRRAQPAGAPPAAATQAPAAPAASGGSGGSGAPAPGAPGWNR